MHPLILRCHSTHKSIIPRCVSAVHANNFGCRSLFTHNTETYVKLKEKELHVNPGFGVLHVSGTIDFHIRPTNVQEYPDADRAFVAVHGLPSESCEDVTVELTGEQRDILTVCATPKSQRVFCEVMVPIKYDLDVKLMDEGRLKISQMESDEVKVFTENGEVNSRGLKSHNIHITTENGHITSDGSIQGNIFINAKKTHMKAKRLQGLALNIEAKELSTEIESSYMNQAQIKADKGTIKINNLHGCTDLLVKQGQIVVNGFHGQIAGFMGSGKVEMQVTEVTGHSTLHLKEGSMKLSVLDTPRHTLEVKAPSLSLSEEVRTCGTLSQDNSQVFTISSDDPETNALQATVVSGEAHVDCQNWFSTLGIKLPNK
ncbi:uncharacterized protein LOC123506117 isoform X2 [Portunus trituberculatus]|uniref:uncharacterized protein LOC123506117 isoform X2 n=1 Tax=Portunus trituberculatus TaxID=210409 RepID=UPI001E1CB942|nr:uncharacterized protein LOC123506117 isoform X2 [Portunus trituberculatus]